MRSLRGEVISQHPGSRRVADETTAMIKPMMASCQSVARRSPSGRLVRYWSGAIARPHMYAAASASGVGYISAR